jgi:putative hydrolase of the HAD superfamily
MIKNIIFDLGGVLLDIDLLYCMRQMEALGVDLKALETKGGPTPAGVKGAVLGEGLVANGVMHLYQVGGISTEEFLEGVRRHCRPGTTREEVLKAWNTCCIGIPQYRLDQIAQLRQQGYRIFMLSNTNDAHWQDIKTRCMGGQANMDKYFDQVFLSQEMHMAKPNDDIFLKVLEDIGAKAEDCLFLDDSTANVEAARALGFHATKVEVSKTQNGKVVAPPSEDWTTTINQILE